MQTATETINRTHAPAETARNVGPHKCAHTVKVLDRAKKHESKHEDPNPTLMHRKQVPRRPLARLTPSAKTMADLGHVAFCARP